MKFRAVSPMRMSFFGGNTDVPDYFTEYGGAVLSATISFFAYATFETEGRLRFAAEDLGVEEEGAESPGKLPLHWGVAKELGVTQGEIRTFSDAPSGSGLGNSSALTVAMIASVLKARGEGIERERVARLAVRVERELLRQKGGWQDQYAATYGGLNFIEFSREGVRVERLELQEALKELNYRVVMFYTGATHSSSEIHEDISRQRRLENLHRLKELAYKGRKALLDNDFDLFGELLHEGWLMKKGLSSKVSNDLIDRAYERGREAGALGGKIMGAGGGGFLMLFVREGKRGEVVRAVSELGLRFTPFTFVLEGVKAWKVRE